MLGLVRAGFTVTEGFFENPAIQSVCLETFWGLLWPALECTGPADALLKFLDHIVSNPPLFLFALLAIAVAREFDLAPHNQSASFSSPDGVLQFAY